MKPKTVQDLLDWMDKYSESFLSEAEKESNSVRSKELYSEYNGMKKLITASTTKLDEDDTFFKKGM